MLNKILGTVSITAAAVAAMSFASPAEARSGYYQGYGDAYFQRIDDDDRRYYRRGDYYRGDRYYDRRDRRYYREKRRYRHDRRRYRGCDRGTGGTIIGAIAGGLLGNEIARRGDKTEGTIIGGAVGALAGRAIDGNC